MRQRKGASLTRILGIASLLLLAAPPSFAQSRAETRLTPSEAAGPAEVEPETQERSATSGNEQVEDQAPPWRQDRFGQDEPSIVEEAYSLPSPEDEGEVTEFPTPKKQNSAPGGFGGMMGSGPPGYNVTWLPSQSVADQPHDLGVLRQHFSLTAPIRRTDSGMLLSSIRLSDSHFFTSALRPDTQRDFPTDLANISLGLTYMHRFENGWSGVVITSFGSASDKPFHALRDMNYMTGGFLQIPVREGRDAWMLGAIYSPVGMLNFPIPLVGYSWRPSDTFHMNIGLPLSLMWKPTEALTVNLSYVPLTNINAVATYQLTQRLALYGGYKFFNESHFLADRENTQDRFFSLEQHVFCGAKINVWRNAYLDLGAGYAFDRRFGEGRNQTSRLHDEVKVDPSAYLSLGLGWQF